MKRKKLKNQKKKQISHKPISIYWGLSFAAILIYIGLIFEQNTKHLVNYEVNLPFLKFLFYLLITIWGLWALGGKNGNIQRAIFPITLAILPYIFNRAIVSYMEETNKEIVVYKAILVGKKHTSSRRGGGTNYIFLKSKEYGREELKIEKNLRLYRYTNIGNEVLVYKNVFGFGYFIDETKIKLISK